MKPQTYDAYLGPGTFEADMVREGSRYELSDGHPIYCAPCGGSHAESSSSSSLVLGTDPDVDEVGVDVGYTPKKNMLRAPDVAVGNVPNKPGWVQGAPRLALEIADVGQDEKDLMIKVQEFLEAGTEQVWVVRLVGPRRVEVWRQDGTASMYTPGQHILAPGILRRPVLVDSLFDPELAREAALGNMLARHGYNSLDEVRDEGAKKGRQEGERDTARRALRAVMDARGLRRSTQEDDQIDAADLDTLSAWLRAAALADDAAQVFGR